ncbi:MAG TPA: alpha/beta hydrolase [Nevskiaceae bacterium]|nr:alpha/beta hydrolase [Nevskiaceae bacterium]
MTLRIVRVWVAFALLAAAQLASGHDYQTFDSDGCQIAYTDYGSGEPVIFLHGFSGNFDQYLGPVGDALSQQFRAIGLDQRGHGRSCKPHDADAYGRHFAGDVLNLMDRLHIAKAHVVGHSMGGIVAMYLAANYPARVQSAVTVGNGLFSRRELTLIGWLMRGSFAWRHVKEFFGAADDNRPPGNDDVALILAVRSLRDLAVTNAQAAALKVPVLAVRGGPKDDPNDTVERLSAINPNVEMLRLEPEDHISTLANAKFRQELKSFLERRSVRAGS